MVLQMHAVIHELFKIKANEANDNKMQMKGIGIVGL